MRVAAININIYSCFWLFSIWPATLRIQENISPSCAVLPDTGETKLGRSNQVASPSVSKNIALVLVPCCAWKCAATAISSSVDTPEGLELQLVEQMSSQCGLQKLLQGLVSHKLTACLSDFYLFLDFWLNEMTIFLKVHKPDDFESQNFVKLSFIKI